MGNIRIRVASYIGWDSSRDNSYKTNSDENLVRGIVL